MPIDDQRKHRMQMSPEEISTVTKYVHSIKHWDISGHHLYLRMIENHVSKEDILDVLKYGKLIEVHHNNYPQVRIVMRDTVGGADICVCCEASGMVVTVWINHLNDHHSTLKKHLYQWKVDLDKLFKMYYL